MTLTGLLRTIYDWSESEIECSVFTNTLLDFIMWVIWLYAAKVLISLTKLYSDSTIIYVNEYTLMLKWVKMKQKSITGT